MYFDSRSERFKTPYGAVTCGTKVTLSLQIEPYESVTSAFVIAYSEFANDWTATKLTAVEQDGRKVFTGIYTAPEEPELVWYHFKLNWADGGESCFGKNGSVQKDAVQPWQLTVYDAASKTPGWFGSGVSYQIFPDRFRRGVKRDLAESCKWFALAALEADEGETRAAEALAALENSKELTPEVKLAARAEAEKLYKQIFGEEKLLPALKQ